MNPFLCMRYLFLVGLLLCSPGFAGTPGLPDRHLRIDHWNVEDGLPHNSVSAALQTREGLLWIGTLRGVVRFDGVQFRPLDSLTRAPGRVRDILALEQTNDGSLWIGTEGSGLFRLSGDSLQQFDVAHGFPFGTILALTHDSTGTLWVATESNGIVALAPPYTRESTTRIGIAQGLPSLSLRDIQALPDGSIWAACTNHRPVVVHPGRALVVTLPTDVPGGTVSTLSLSPDGHLLLGTPAGGFLLRDGAYHRILPGAMAPNDFYTDILIDHEGNAWGGTYLSGLRFASRGHDESYTPRNGLAGYYVGSLSTDREGSVWVSTENGLDRFRRVSIQTLGEAEGLLPEAVNSMALDSLGTVWLATDGGGVYTAQGGTAHVVRTTPTPPESLYVNTIAVGHDGTVILATSRRGMLGLRAGRLTQLPYVERTATIRTFLQTRDGGMWLATNAAVIRWRHGERKTFADAGGVPLALARALVEDGSGAIWVATTSALIRIQGDSARVVGTPAWFSGTPLYSLYCGSDGTVYVGSQAGLGVWIGDSLVVVGASRGLPDDMIGGMAEDSLGFLWLGSARGVIRVNREELLSVAQGRASRVHALEMGVSDGMTRSECIMIGTGTVLRTRDRELWFATTAGIARVRPSTLEFPDPGVPVLIDAVTSRFHRFPSSTSITLGADENDIQIAFTLPAFGTPDRVHFRYKLEGVDAGWQEAGTRRTAQYNDLPAGNYLFVVEATVDLGATRRISSASLDVTIEPHFYERTRFYLLVAAGILGLILLSHIVREQFTSARRRELTRLVEERTRELKEEIAERTRVETALRNAEAHQAEIMRVIPVMIYSAENPSPFGATWISPNTAAVTGFPVDRFAGERDFWVSRIHSEDRHCLEEQMALLREGRPADIQYRWRVADGSYRWFLDHAIPARSLPDGRLEYFGIWYDITDQRDAAERLRSSLREKDALLKEIHHRVKNNLSVITSLLSLQSHSVADPHSQEVLREAENRVRSMAAIHEQLYRSTNLAAIDFEAYASRLLGRLQEAYRMPGLSFETSIKGVFLEIAVAIPCGLIINELVTNSLKYAFPNGGPGSIRVEVVPTVPGRMRLSVSDSGIGFKAPTTLGEAPTLGLRLVDILTDQMGGTVTFDSTLGTTCVVEFPLTRDH